jgi:hypothetical protein
VDLVTPFQHMGPEWVDRPWWGTFGWLLPLLLVAVLTGLVVWAVLRTSRHPAVVAMPATGPLPAAPLPTTGPLAPATIVGAPVAGADPALEAARMRYARGEMTRDEFLQVSRDLGAPTATPEATEEDGADA